jgi:hypothetical protein
VTSIFQRALGGDFDRLHPRLRERFGFATDDGIACVGTGVMDEVWRGSPLADPFLRLGTLRHILFPDRGTDVPFTIENYAYRDGFGRETVTFVRTFDVRPGRRRRFDATMVYCPRRESIVDFLGTHQHVAVGLDPTVDDRGGLWLRTTDSHCGWLPLPRALSGRAEVHEWFDDATDRFHIDVRVSNPVLGPVFGYRGWFTTHYVNTGTAPVPAAVRPLRERVAA